MLWQNFSARALARSDRTHLVKMTDVVPPFKNPAAIVVPENVEARVIATEAGPIVGDKAQGQLEQSQEHPAVRDHEGGLVLVPLGDLGE